MKKYILIFSAVLFSTATYSQESAATLGGGYSFATGETGVKLSGFRINGSYEFNPQGGNLAHGLSIGFMGMSGSTSSVAGNTEYKINSWPIYYAPKLMFGNGSIKGFVKGAIGMQFSSLKRSGVLVGLSDSDFGFYGGAAAGFMKTINEKIFINLEYEFAYLANGFYNDGFVNSIMLGVGMKF